MCTHVAAVEEHKFGSGQSFSIKGLTIAAVGDAESVVTDLTIGHHHQPAAGIGRRHAHDLRPVNATQGGERLCIGLGKSG